MDNLPRYWVSLRAGAAAHAAHATTTAATACCPGLNRYKDKNQQKRSRAGNQRAFHAQHYNALHPAACLPPRASQDKVNFL
jgi:hypothetical protein